MYCVDLHFLASAQASQETNTSKLWDRDKAFLIWVRLRGMTMSSFCLSRLCLTM